MNTAINPNRRAWLQNVEYGGRPLAYFHAKFLNTGTNWMGEIDCGCATDEQLNNCVMKIQAEYLEFKKIRDLQFEFIDEHEDIAPGVIKVTYSNGKVIVINYNDVPATWNGMKVPAYDFLVTQI